MFDKVGRHRRCCPSAAGSHTPNCWTHCDKPIRLLLVRRSTYQKGVGLFFGKLLLPLKVAVFADAGGNAKRPNYAREAVVVLWMHSDRPEQGRIIKYVCEEWNNDTFSGTGHCLEALGRNARKKSWSIAQGETPSAVGGQELGQMIAARLTEVLTARPMSRGKIIKTWAMGLFVVSVDHLTGCNDFFEMATGDKALPQDKRHRLYAAAIRELRVTGRIRRFTLVPTNVDVSRCFNEGYAFSTHGEVHDDRYCQRKQRGTSDTFEVLSKDHKQCGRQGSCRLCGDDKTVLGVVLQSAL